MYKRVLTVDDSKTMRSMLSRILRSAGFEVLEAPDGKEALGLLDKESVDIVITDINMPNMDGVELIKTMRGMHNLQGLPILIVSTETDKNKKKEVRSAGATGWLQKPFNPDKLVHVVQRVCA